jgi:wyosine [tRNA(Phe)-imidazoG37] synthetase (radical SAM superfamily)
MRYKHLFGPVHSRRLGYSLGVDLVPYKYCPLDCVYCEAQKTTHFLSKRREFFPVEEIIGELKDYLGTNPDLDYITFSGAGEPTLYSKIGKIIRFIKSEYPKYKLALLTNGMLLKNATLRKEILPCDLILPSLDACLQETFLRLNRPQQPFMADDLVEGLVSLRSDYGGEIWLEVFIIPGLNDNDKDMNAICSAITKIKPDKVQLNSLDRPGAEKWVKPAGIRSLSKIQHYMRDRLTMPVEIIAKTEPSIEADEIPIQTEQALEAILEDQPMTADMLAKTLDIHINEISKYLRLLHGEHKIKVISAPEGALYRWNN